MTVLHGDAIRHRREELRLTVTDVADAVGIPATLLRTIEREHNPAAVRHITLGVVHQLADYLGLPIEELVRREPAPHEQTSPPCEPPAASALMAVLLNAATAEHAPNRQHVKGALGWNDRRLTEAVNRLNPRLRAVGLNIRQQGNAIQLCTPRGHTETIRRYNILATVANATTDDHAPTLHSIATRGANRKHMDDRVLQTVADLLNQGLVQLDGGQVVLADPMNESLSPADHPPP